MRNLILVIVLIGGFIFNPLSAQDSTKVQKSPNTRYSLKDNKQKFSKLNAKIEALRIAGRFDEALREATNLKNEYALGEFPTTLLLYNDLDEYFKLDSLIIDFFRSNSYYFKDKKQLDKIKKPHPYLYKRIKHFMPNRTSFSVSQIYGFINSFYIGGSFEANHSLNRSFNFLWGVDVERISFKDDLESPIFDNDFTLIISKTNFDLYAGISYEVNEFAKQNLSFLPHTVSIGLGQAISKRNASSSIRNSDIDTLTQNFPDFDYHHGKFWLRLGAKYKIFEPYYKKIGRAGGLTLEVVLNKPLSKEYLKFNQGNLDFFNNNEINIKSLNLRPNLITEIRLNMIGFFPSFIKKDFNRKINTLNLDYAIDSDSVRDRLKSKKKRDKNQKKLKRKLLAEYKFQQNRSQFFDMTKFHKLDEKRTLAVLKFFEKKIKKTERKVSVQRRRKTPDALLLKQLEDDYINTAELVSHYLIKKPNKITPYWFSFVLSKTGWLKILRGDFEGSEKAIRQGLSIEKNDHYLNENLAHALLLQGKFEKAKEQYLKLENRPLYDDPNHKTSKTIFLNDLKLFQSLDIIPDDYIDDVIEIIDILEQ